MIQSQEMVSQYMLPFGKTVFYILLRLISQQRVLAKTSVTPYKHIIVYPNTKLYLLETFNGIKQCTGQGVEKTYNITEIYLNMTQQQDISCKTQENKKQIQKNEANTTHFFAYREKENNHGYTTKYIRIKNKDSKCFVALICYECSELASSQ